MKTEKEKSGFYDLPKPQKCNHPNHEPPKHLFIPQGKGYRHVCPACGTVTNLVPPQISCESHSESIKCPDWIIEHNRNPLLW